MNKVILSLLFLFATTAVLAAAKQTHKEQIGNWTVSQYHSENGAFSHCIVTTDFLPANKENQKRMKTRVMNFAVKFFDGETMALVINGPDWNFKNEKMYKIGFNFDNGRTFSVDAAASPPYGVYQEFPVENSDWVKSIMESKTMELLIDDYSLGLFDLTDSRKAFTSFLECWGVNTKETFEKTNPEQETFGGNQ